MKAIDWGKWSAIAQVFGTLATAVTLIYLAVQSQQTTSALLANSRQATMTADVAVIAAAIGAPRAWANLHRPLAELSPEERDQRANLLAGLLRVREYAWFQYKNGILDEAALRTYEAPVNRWLRYGDTMTVWQQFATEFDPEFVSYVDQMLRDSEPRPPQQ
jgi:hypothetical protein